MNMNAEPNEANPLLLTSRNSWDIYTASRQLKLDDISTQAQEVFLWKIGKTIGDLNVKQTVQKATIQKLSSQIESFWSFKVKKWVQTDSNTKFATIEQIKQALDETAALETRVQAREPEIQAKKTAAAVVKAGLQACMSEWQTY